LKIIHFADLHLGVENYGDINPVSGLSTRLEDFLAALDQLVDYALENRADLVLFCGDTYKSREPSQTQQREFARRINRLTTGGIPIFLLAGNHDMSNRYLPHSDLKRHYPDSLPALAEAERLTQQGRDERP